MSAAPADAYRDAMSLAASGKNNEAIAYLHGALSISPRKDTWRERIAAAAALLSMRSQFQARPVFSEDVPQQSLVAAYMRNHPAPEHASPWIAGVMAVLLPGSGHAWQGRWRDAGAVAMMVWPMLLLTVWAAKRRMGPVTVFFGLITVWLWSGTAFSAVSLAERGSVEAYLLWWQGIWQASGLPGQPW
ncbi:MAG: hypothetical protein ACE5F3_08650 [Mariprofundaceae bacterium]